MFVTHAHNIRFETHWANCCGCLPVNVNVVLIYSKELEANELDCFPLEYFRSSLSKITN